MANYLAHIAERVINQPLLIQPEKLEMIAQVLEGRINIDASGLLPKPDAESVEAPKPEGSRYVGEFAPADPSDPRKGRKPYRTTAEGTAIIPVHGSLVNRGGFLDAMSGIMSYEKLKYQVSAAAADDDVVSILLDIDSGGGEAVGAFEASDVIRAASKVKPMVALANGLCCSAAYMIASGAPKIVTSRSSVTGSIGTVMLHLDRSKQLADAGIKPTLITTGKRKGDGNPFFELTDEVKGELKSYITRVNSLFVSTVAASRGITAEAVLAMEAGVFIGAEAIDQKLVDEVGSFESVFAELQRDGANRRTIHAKPRGILMAKENNAEASASEITQASLDAAVTAAKADGHKAGHAEGLKAANDRLKAVTSHASYTGREASALHMLTTTDMSADAITGVLAGLPAAPAAAAAPQLPADRAQSAPGGLAVVDANASKEPAPANDFEKGKQIAKSLGLNAR